MTSYWYMNNLVRPGNRPLPRNVLPQPWIGHARVVHTRAFLPNRDDDNPIAYQTWEQAIDRHLRSQAQLFREDLEADLEEHESTQSSIANDLTDPLGSDIDQYSPPPVNYPDTEEEEHAFQVEREFRQLRAPQIAPGISSVTVQIFPSRNIDSLSFFLFQSHRFPVSGLPLALPILHRYQVILLFYWLLLGAFIFIHFAP